MINPLSELSAIYNQNIAEGCECDEKKKVKVKGELPGTKRPDGGDGAAPNDGKNLLVTGNVPMGGSGAKRRVSKYAVEPMASESKEESKIGGGNLKKLASKANTRIDADIDGDVDTNDPKSTQMGEFVPSADGKKKIKTMARFESNIYSNWRDNSQELLEVINGGLYGGSEDDTKNLENKKAKTDTKAGEKITEKEIKNKIKINPPQGVTEGFAELGGVIVEMYELEEDAASQIVDVDTQIARKRLQRAQLEKKVVFKKSSQSSQEQEVHEETEEDKKKRELEQKTRDHDDKKSAKVAEGALSGVLSTIRAKNGMKTVTAKGADKLQDKKNKTMGEENKMSAFDVVKKQIKDKYGEKSLIDTKAPKKQPSPEQRKADAQRRSKNYSDNNKNYNPYKSRAGESD
jgi:hypothetical protein